MLSLTFRRLYNHIYKKRRVVSFKYNISYLLLLQSTALHAFDRFQQLSLQYCIFMVHITSSCRNSLWILIFMQHNWDQHYKIRPELLSIRTQVRGNSHHLPHQTHTACLWISFVMLWERKIESWAPHDRLPMSLCPLENIHFWQDLICFPFSDCGNISPQAFHLYTNVFPSVLQACLCTHAHRHTHAHADTTTDTKRKSSAKSQVSGCFIFLSHCKLMFICKNEEKSGRRCSLVWVSLVLKAANALKETHVLIIKIISELLWSIKLFWVNVLYVL